MEVCIRGMSCRSCELKIEKAWRSLPGVAHVSADAVRGRARIVCHGDAPSRHTLNDAIREHGYELMEDAVERITQPARPSVLQLVFLFSVVLLAGTALSRLGLLQLTGVEATATGFASAFLIGLVAASSSCLAVAGGLMLSVVARPGTSAASRSTRLLPVGLFIVGRVAGYAGLGALIGLIGQALTPPPIVTGLLMVAAALYMLTVGLEMLHLAPAWLRRLTPRMPKAIARRVMDVEGHPHPLAAVLLGAGTFFLPCGFTQSLQLAALASGSPVVGATILGGFALGTAPALAALGWASTKLTGRIGVWFFRFSGALVIILGLWNVQNGLTVAGFPLSLPTLARSGEPVEARQEGETQVVDIRVGTRGYTPNVFVVKKNQPVELRLSGKTTGCLSALVIPGMRIQAQLNPTGITRIPFTPTREGTYSFACGMGMYRGSFRVTAS